jgi:hypothetical protein
VLGNAGNQWYIQSDCPFTRSAFLDVVSLCGFTLLRKPEAFRIIHKWEVLTNIVSIGPQYALEIGTALGEALLRRSLAEAFFIDRVILRNNSLGSIVSPEYQDIEEALAILADGDPDTCCTALDVLDRIFKLKSANGLTIPLDLVLAHVHGIALYATDPEVTSKAQAIVANILEDTQFKSDFFNLMTIDQVFSTLTNLEAQCLTGPPANVQSALHLLGFFLDHAYYASEKQRRFILEAIARYIRLLRMTIIDTNPFDMRFAAVQSLTALERVWTAPTTSNATAPLILGLSLVLYDLLNDDDDEIRDIAARTTGKFLRAQGFREKEDVVPLLASHRLAQYLARTFTQSPDLSKEAVRRLTGTPSPAPFFSTPFAQTLAEQRKEDTALFATEKQNLYRDDTLDAVYWSRILIALPIRAPLLHNLNDWVLDALAVLTETAMEEEDGALGWTSKPEVFTLGIRVFCAAEVVLKWDTGEARKEVLKALSHFADVGSEREVHGLWLDRIKRVLEKQVLGVLGRVKGTLLAIEV